MDITLKITIKYLLDCLYPELGNKNLPWVDPFIEIMHELLNLNPNIANGATNKLFELREEYPHVNEINYLNGRICQLCVKPDYKAAASFFAACSPDYSPALSVLSYFYAHGEHGETNYPLAMKLLKEAVFKDGKVRSDAFPAALFNYGVGLYHGKFLDHIEVEADKKQGFDFILKSADLEYPFAQEFVGSVLCKEGKEAKEKGEETLARGIQYLLLAARQDDPDATLLLLHYAGNRAVQKSEELYSDDNFKNIIPFVEAFDIAVKLTEKFPGKYPELKEKVDAGTGDETLKVVMKQMKNELTKFKARTFQIEDIKERNEALTKVAEWGDRDCQFMLGLMYEGRKPGIVLIDSTKTRMLSPAIYGLGDCAGERPIQVTLDHKKSKKKTIAHYEHIVEKEQTAAPAFQLAFFLEYGLGKTKNKRFRNITQRTAEKYLSEIYTEEDLYPKAEAVKIESKELEKASQMDTKKDEQPIEMAQLNGNLLKAFDYYKKAARAFSPDYTFTYNEKNLGHFRNPFGMNGEIDYDYFYGKLKKLAHVVQVRREVANALDTCGINLRVAGKKLDPVNLIANYHGIEGNHIKTDGDSGPRGRKRGKHF